MHVGQEEYEPLKRVLKENSEIVNYYVGSIDGSHFKYYKKINFFREF